MYKKQNFSLIELLVVIAIIAILASIVVVGGKKLRQRGQVAEARTALVAVRAAVISYKKDYDRFPFAGNNPVTANLPTNDSLVFTSTQPGDNLMNRLTGQDTTVNPRRINFLPNGFSYASPWYAGNSFAGYAIAVGMDNNLDGDIKDSVTFSAGSNGIKSAAEAENYGTRNLVVFMRAPDFMPIKDNLTAF